MTNRCDWLNVFEEFEIQVNIAIGNGDYMSAYGKDNTEVEIFVNGEPVISTMCDVLFVPNIKHNLFSVANKGIYF